MLDSTSPDNRAGQLRLLALGEAIKLRRLLEEVVAAEVAGETITSPREALEHLEDAIALLTPEPPEDER